MRAKHSTGKNNSVTASFSKRAVTETSIRRWRNGKALKPSVDQLTAEEPLEIRVQGRAIAVTMRTPGHDSELAAGFLLSEGLIQNSGDIIQTAYCQRGESVWTENVLNVFLSPSVQVDFDQLTRHVFASSSCGICGKSTIEAVHQRFAPVHAKMTVKVKKLLLLPESFRRAQETFNCTGGIHAAAVFDSRGKLLVLREDVGRHNAVDKVIGSALLQKQLPLDGHILLVSGRASFEIMQKALAAQIPIVAAVSAPSSLAVAFARESGQTLVGFLRDRSLNVYSGQERVVGSVS